MRRSEARLGSAHARNDRGCRQIEAVNATQHTQPTPRGTLKKKTRLKEEEQNTGKKFNKRAKI